MRISEAKRRHILQAGPAFVLNQKQKARQAGGQEEYTTDDDDDRTKGVQAATLFKVFTCRPRPSRQRDPVAFPSAAADVGSGRRKGCTGHVAVHWDSVGPRNRDSLNSTLPELHTPISLHFTRFLRRTLFLGSIVAQSPHFAQTLHSQRVHQTRLSARSVHKTFGTAV